MFRHILPNCLSPILVISTVQVANAIMSEAALSFLGLGLPVDQPSLGALISIGFNYIFSELGGLLRFLALFGDIVLVINLLGDWLRDVFNLKSIKAKLTFGFYYIIHPTKSRSKLRLFFCIRFLNIGRLSKCQVIE